MIYLDNASTGGFKISAVKDACKNAIEYLCANPARSGHKLSRNADEFVFLARKSLMEYFNAPSLERVIFTKNCTEALSLAINSFCKKGRHIVSTVTEHNSVIRNLYHLRDFGVDFSLASPTQNSPVTLKNILPLVQENTDLIIVNAVSNVTGTANGYREIGRWAKAHGKIFMLDGAQAVGHIPLDMKKDYIDILAFSGHKGLGGIMGSGGLIFGENVEISPLLYGGTGTESFSPQPNSYPEKLESGTLNLPAICALYEAVEYAKIHTQNKGQNLISKTKYLIDNLSQIEGVKVYSSPNPCGITAFEIIGLPSSEAVEIYSQKYDIALRGGFHCAPFMHINLGTQDRGLVRASISTFNTIKELNMLILATKKICAKTF